MLTVTIPAIEQYNELTNEFINSKEQTLQLEHSLVSLSKWESKWKKPFLNNKNQTPEESMDYIRCMSLTKNIYPILYENIPLSVLKEIREYIDDPMTATTIRDSKRSGGSKEQLTAELIYYYMVAFGIPFECEKWHLNRLITLIRVCDIKNRPAQKMSRGDVMRQNSSLNAARRQQLGSRG